MTGGETPHRSIVFSASRHTISDAIQGAGRQVDQMIKAIAAAGATALQPMCGGLDEDPKQQLEWNLEDGSTLRTSQMIHPAVADYAEVCLDDEDDYFFVRLSPIPGNAPSGQPIRSIDKAAEFAALALQAQRAIANDAGRGQTNRLQRIMMAEASVAAEDHPRFSDADSIIFTAATPWSPPSLELQDGGGKFIGWVNVDHAAIRSLDALPISLLVTIRAREIAVSADIRRDQVAANPLSRMRDRAEFIEATGYDGGKG